MGAEISTDSSPGRTAPVAAPARAGASAARTAAVAFLLALTGAVAPGPLLVLVISQVLAQGWPAVLFILAGHAAVELLFVLILARGLGRVLRRDAVRGLLGAVGGMVLAWMGAVLLAEAGTARMDWSAGDAMSRGLLVLAGAGVSLSNPYFTGWWATVGSGQVATFGLRTWRDCLPFYVGHEAGDAAWYLAVAALLTLGRTHIPDLGYRLLLGGCAVATLLLGGLFLFLAARLLVPRGARPP
jgi:threonine/homoserine/homoserine lactone efflux protein